MQSKETAMEKTKEIMIMTMNTVPTMIMTMKMKRMRIMRKM